MFAKLVVVIVVMGATSAALLVARQQRIERARETALLHEEILAQQRRLQELRCQIAGRCRPEELHLDIGRLDGPWEPIVLEPPRPPTALALALHEAGRMP